MKKHQFSHTVVEHHKDGSSTIHHVNDKHGYVHNTPVRDGDVRGAAGNHDEMLDHMIDHTGMPNDGEDKDEEGKALVAGPAAQALAAGQQQGA